VAAFLRGDCPLDVEVAPVSSSSALPVRQNRSASAAERREWLLFLLLVGPNLLLFAVFTYWPLIYNGYLSFVRWDMLSPVKLWVGLDNYRYLFTSPAFGGILRNTLVFTGASVLLTCGLGLGMALLLNQPLQGRNTVRSIVFSPVMLSGAAIGLVWTTSLTPAMACWMSLSGLLGYGRPIGCSIPGGPCGR
jgi:ABC-type sugar transport system permease subunit